MNRGGRSSYIDNGPDAWGGGAHYWEQFIEERVAWLYGDQDRSQLVADDLAAWARLLAVAARPQTKSEVA